MCYLQYCFSQLEHSFFPVSLLNGSNLSYFFSAHGHIFPVLGLLNKWASRFGHSSQIVNLSMSPHATASKWHGFSVSCAMMSLLTVILRFLGLLATLSGCNIYIYLPQRCKFKRQRRLQFIVTQLHRFWLRPWLIFSIAIHLFWFLRGFVKAISALESISDNSLMVVYYFSAIITKYQNVCLTFGIVYIYKYQRNRVLWVLNEFVIIYHNSRVLYGRAPRVNWWLFLVYLKEIYKASALPSRPNNFSHIPFVNKKSIMNTIFSWANIIFVIVQPFILSLLAHLGLLLLHSFYDQALQVKRCRTAVAYRHLLKHYVALIRLRQRYETLLRPFVGMALISDFNACMICLHLLLYDKHKVALLLVFLITFAVYPLCFMHHTTRMHEAEQQFGNQLLDFKRKSQKQLKVSEH